MLVADGVERLVKQHVGVERIVLRARLFFRYSEKEKVIILGWMNDENTLRTYGKKTDAYTVFSKMLKRGHPPADWESLTQETEETH